ncbi:hypothetical protein HK102_000908, partial [Quaeritorhiza haematococci]
MVSIPARAGGHTKTTSVHAYSIPNTATISEKLFLVPIVKCPLPPVKAVVRQIVDETWRDIRAKQVEAKKAAAESEWALLSARRKVAAKRPRQDTQQQNHVHHSQSSSSSAASSSSSSSASLSHNHNHTHHHHPSKPEQLQKDATTVTKLPINGTTYQDVEREVWKRTRQIVEAMIAEMDNARVLRFSAFIVNNLLVRLYHQGIHIRESEFIEVRKYAEIAEKNRCSMIFLPCHKSHVDYLVISYVFYRLGLALPHIAAGDNLNLPVVGWILKHAGAFFIRRSWGNDSLYWAIMREYIGILLEKGHNMEAFIEGGRSRIGKLLQPKFGILKLVLEAVVDGMGWDRDHQSLSAPGQNGKRGDGMRSHHGARDAIIVPMSIGYDKVIETSSYVNELLGRPKEKESLAQLFNSAGVLQFKWGRIDVRFAKPFSLREYIESQVDRRGPSFDPITNPSDRQLVLSTLGFKVLEDINSVSVIMPTGLVGTVLLTLRGRGVGRDELIRKVNWLKREIVKKGGRVADFGGMPTGVIVDRAVQVLRDLIGTRLDLLEPVFYPVKRFELSFYRNQAIHLFISEAIISASIYATIKLGGPTTTQKVRLYPTLHTDAQFLSSLLKHEFIYA